MRLLRLWNSWFIAFVLLKTAARFVPRASRVEWLAEWKGELWHVGRACGAPTQRGCHNEKKITAFCIGAFQDAFTLHSWREPPYVARRLAKRIEPGSPLRCALLLAGFFALSLGLSLSSPQVRRAMLAATAQPSDRLALISRDGYFGDTVPTVALEEYRAWKASHHSFSKQLIFYRAKSEWVQFAIAPPARLRVAYASESILKVLGPSLPSVLSPSVLVSRKLWRQYFGNAAGVRGQTIHIAGQTATVVGVAAQESWSIPGDMDIVLVESDAALSALPHSTAGFVLAPGIEPMLHEDDPGHPYLLATQPSGSVVRYECAALAERRIRPTSLFLLALVLACIALPATTPLPLGEYGTESLARRTTHCLRRWAFLSIKLVVAASAVYCTSLCVAYMGMPEGSPPAEYCQLFSAFCGLLFAMRWAIRDQRKRCPACLRLLTQPAHVGHPSRCFLAWHGTEMLCSSGHGLLYIPEHPTSWFSKQRWQSLDASWSSLFQA